MCQRSLAIEGMLTTICDTLGCNEFEFALSIITTLSRDQATLNKLKEDQENEKKLFAKLKDDVTKPEERKIRVLKHNSDLELSMKEKEFDLNKHISTLDADLEEKKSRL